MNRLTKIIVIASVLIGIAVFLWFAFRGSSTPLSQPAKSTTIQSNPQSPADRLLSLVNTERKKAGVKELKIDDRLNKSAQWKVDDMLTNNYLGYVKPGEQQPNGLGKIFENTGKDCGYANEILVWDADKRTMTPEAAVDYWMKSDSNKKTILDPGYTTTGFGIGQYAIVEHFCQPA